MRPVLATTAFLLGIGAGAPTVPVTEAAGDPTSRAVVAAETHLSVRSAGRLGIQMEETLALRLRRTHPLVARLRGAAPETHAFQATATTLLDEVGFLPSADRPPVLRTGRGTSQLILVSTRTLGDQLRNGRYAPSDGSWSVAARGRRLVFRVRAGRLRVPWRVTVRSEAARVASASPLPYRDDGERNLEWNLRSPVKPVLVVELVPPEGVRPADEPIKRGALLSGSSYLALGTPFGTAVLGLWLARRKRSARTASTPGLGASRAVVELDERVLRGERRLWLIGLVGLVFAAVCLWQTALWVHRFDASGEESVATLIAESFPAVVALSLLAALGRERPTLVNPWPWSVLILGTALAVGLALVRPSANGFLVREETSLYVWTAASYETLLALAGTVGVAFAVWAALPCLPRRRSLPRYWVGLLGVLALAVVAQWVYGTVSGGPDRSSLYPPVPRRGWLIELSSSVTSFPDYLLPQTLAALQLAVIAGALSLLAARAAKASSSAFDDDGWSLRVVAFLFAVAVVGTGGVFGPVVLPVAFLVCLGLMLGLLRPARVDPVRRLEEEEEEEEACRVPATIRGELIDRATEVEIERRRADQLESQYLSGEVNRTDYVTGREEADLGAGGPLRWMARGDVRALVFGVGPGITWWDNARKAGKIGAGLAVVPLVYYVVVLVQGLPESLSGPSYEGILGLVVGVFREATTWLVAALVLGAVYPYLPGNTGVTKGASLAIVSIVAVAVAVVLGDQRGVGWAFRGLELLVFLTVVGLLMDRKALRAHGFGWRRLATLYRLGEFRFAAGYLSTLGVALLAVAQQLISGDAQNVIQKVIESASQIAPPAP